LKRIALSFQEPIIRNFFRSVLQGPGFLVQDVAPCIQPSDAADCILECWSDHERPDLMVFDVVVDRACTGVEAAQKALQRFPGVKILLTSATPPAVWPDPAPLLFAALPENSCAFLSKPFTAQQLRATVEALLDGAA
jgi:CheY-like chemotaxis protein